MTPAHCKLFRGMAIAPQICASWVRPIAGENREPFCLRDQECETEGRRLKPKVEYQVGDDGEID